MDRTRRVDTAKPARVNTDPLTAVGYRITLKMPNAPEQPKHPIVDAKHLEVARRLSWAESSCAGPLGSFRNRRCPGVVLARLVGPLEVNGLIGTSFTA